MPQLAAGRRRRWGTSNVAGLSVDTALALDEPGAAEAAAPDTLAHRDGDVVMSDMDTAGSGRTGSAAAGVSRTGQSSSDVAMGVRRAGTVARHGWTGRADNDALAARRQCRRRAVLLVQVA
jgi:hypothetical protein